MKKSIKGDFFILKVVAPMAGITDSAFLNKVIPYGFNVATLGGFNVDEATINAASKIIERGRKEFYFPIDVIFNHIEKEANLIKEKFNDVKVSVNLRSTSPLSIIEVSRIDNVDIVEINCHCRQNEFLAIGCGQNMLLKDDLGDFISQVSKNAESEVSVKFRANVSGVDDLAIAKLIEDNGADYIHVDAMNPGVFDADFELVSKIVSSVNIPVIGNNSLNTISQIEKMIKTGVSGFSIARAIINGKLDFNIDNFKFW